MKLRKLTARGSAIYEQWLQVRKPGDMPPESLIEGAEETEDFINGLEIDPTKVFETRYAFGKYIAETLARSSATFLLSERNDAFWNWLTVVYFAQFGQKNSKHWHYVVTRKGHSGALTYRHLARTSFEMYWRHRESSLVMQNVDMCTWGDMSEQLTSRQNIAYHHGCIATANMLYLQNGKLRRGAAGRVPPRAKRKQGDQQGRGGVARLVLAVRRLCRTYDTHILDTVQMLELLPREFAGFAAKAV